MSPAVEPPGAPGAPQAEPTDVPQVDAPPTDTPRMEPAAVPPAEVPQADVPQVDVAQVDVLQADVPQVDVAQADVLQADAPQVDPARRRGRPRRLILAAWLVAGVAALIAVMTVNIGRPSGPIDTPIVGGPAPAFDLETLDGGRLSLAQLRGSPVVLNFWASWCIPCREEAPLLTAAAADYEAQGLRVVGIVYQDSADNARDFMTRYGQTYAGLLDPDGRTAIDYGVFGIPETYFIDAEGIVISRQVGAVTANDLRRQIEAILP